MGEERLTASTVMKESVITVNPENTLSEALEVLARHRISGLPVVDRDLRVVGVLSKTDIIAGVLKDADESVDELVAGMVYRFLRGKIDPTQLDEVLVEQVMTRRVYKARPNTPLREIAELMVKHEINRVPIVDQEGLLVGIVTRSDLLTVLSRL